jgi:hypothetical protein
MEKVYRATKVSTLEKLQYNALPTNDAGGPNMRNVIPQRLEKEGRSEESKSETRASERPGEGKEGE